MLVGLVAVIMVGSARLHRALPASLFAVVVAAVLAGLAGMIAPRIGDLPAGLPAPRAARPRRAASSASCCRPAFAVALLAGLESLLSAKVADGMSDTGRHDPDRELFGQGLANLVAPLFGGMPATGAIARTAVNVRCRRPAPALAAITHAVVLARGRLTSAARSWPRSRSPRSPAC